MKLYDGSYYDVRELFPYTYERLFLNQIRKAIVDKLIFMSHAFATSKDMMVEKDQHKIKVITNGYNNHSYNITSRNLEKEFGEFMSIKTPEDFDFSFKNKIINIFIDDIVTGLNEHQPRYFFKLPHDVPFKSVTTDITCPYPITVTVGHGLDTAPTLSISIGIIEEKIGNFRCYFENQEEYNMSIAERLLYKIDDPACEEINIFDRALIDKLLYNIDDLGDE